MNFSRQVESFGELGEELGLVEVPEVVGVLEGVGAGDGEEIGSQVCEPTLRVFVRVLQVRQLLLRGPEHVRQLE